MRTELSPLREAKSRLSGEKKNTNTEFSCPSSTPSLRNCSTKDRAHLPVFFESVFQTFGLTRESKTTEEKSRRRWCDDDMIEPSSDPIHLSRLLPAIP